MPHILIIDDEAMIREMFRRILELEGYAVSEAAEGNEALARCREQCPDLIITDLIMPDKEGIETIIEIRRDFPETKIIAISGGGRVTAREYLELAETFGADRSLSKPIGREELLAAVRALLPSGAG
jgi:CheY-like chemotaxis protein